MTFASIDLIVIFLVLLLGLKGAISGFFRELPNFIGLIGGVFLASLGANFFVEHKILNIFNPAMERMIIFFVILILIWTSSSYIGKKLLKEQEDRVPSKIERIGGFTLTSLKYFFIFSIIISTLYQTPKIQNKIRKQTKNSILFPVLMEAGTTLVSLPSFREVPHKKI